MAGGGCSPKGSGGYEGRTVCVPKTIIELVEELGTTEALEAVGLSEQDAHADS